MQWQRARDFPCYCTPKTSYWLAHSINAIIVKEGCWALYPLPQEGIYSWGNKYEILFPAVAHFTDEEKLSDLSGFRAWEGSFAHLVHQLCPSKFVLQRSFDLADLIPLDSRSRSGCWMELTARHHEGCTDWPLFSLPAMPCQNHCLRTYQRP